MPQTQVSAVLPQVATSREFYLDRLRTVLTVLVILHHAAITYGSHGYWLYREIEPSGSISSFVLTLFVATNQAWFMGFFFLIAGYFTPPSLDRKGYGPFLLDRYRRLGIPLLIFIAILGPLTGAMAATAHGEAFWPALAAIWRRKEILFGPLWFAGVLLAFNLSYALWRRLRGPQPGDASARRQSPIPGWRLWLLSAILVGSAAFALRLVSPIGPGIYGFFVSYALLFAVGTSARRGNWLRRLSWKQARPWLIVSCAMWPILPLAWRFARPTNYNGGLTWGALLYAMWEPFVAWGFIAALLILFRDRMNRPSPIWDWLNRRAYAVYILHAPVLVGISLLIRNWPAAPLEKFALSGILACAVTWLVSDPFVRIPGLNRIV
jgi:peptidoglycan/LPS O-acetylase OafA/YrhL